MLSSLLSSTASNSICSLMLALNHQYDVHKDPHKNIALPDSLLSRFDLLFVVTDDVDEQRDRMISEHVLRMHRYLQPGLDEGQPAADSLDQVLNVGAPDSTDADGALLVGDSNPFERYNPLLHAGITESGKAKKREVLSIAFVKKYIQYAKQRIHPKLSQPAADWIVNVYANLRNDELSGNQRKTSPLTARTLETLIRLATAHAKSRLSHVVDERDAEAAEEILRFALFKEVIKQRRNNKRQRTGRGSRSPASDEESDEEEDDEAIAARTAAEYSGTGAYATRGAARGRDLQSPPSGRDGVSAARQADASEAEEDEDAIEAIREADRNGHGALPHIVAPPASAVPTGSGSTSEGTLSESRLENFRERVALAMASGGAMAEEETFTLDDVLPIINQGLPAADLFSSSEALSAVQRMHDDGQVMLDEGTIYRI